MRANINTAVIVPKKTLNKWLQMLRFGDIEAISRQSEISRWTLYKAFAGEATDKTIMAINKYYASKKKNLRKRLKQLEFS